MKFLVLAIDEPPIIIKAKDPEELVSVLEIGQLAGCVDDIDEYPTYSIVDGKLTQEINDYYALRKITYKKHSKNGKNILKASYNFKTEQGWVWTSKYVCIEHDGYAHEKAIEWLRERVSEDVISKINTVDDALKESDKFLIPKSVHCIINDAGYPEIVKELF